MVKDDAYLLVTPFAVATPHEYLCSNAEAQSYHEDGYIENASQRRSSQLDFAHTAQKGRIGHTDQLLHERAEQDGVSYGPYLGITEGTHGRTNGLFRKGSVYGVKDLAARYREKGNESTKHCVNRERESPGRTAAKTTVHRASRTGCGIHGKAAKWPI